MGKYIRLIKRVIIGISIKRKRRFMISQKQELSTRTNKIYTMLEVKEIINGIEHVRRLNMFGAKPRKKWTVYDTVEEVMYRDCDEVKVLKYLVNVLKGLDVYSVGDKDGAEKVKERKAKDDSKAKEMG